MWYNGRMEEMAVFPILRRCKVYYHDIPPARLMTERFTLAFIGSGLEGCTATLGVARHLRVPGGNSGTGMLLLFPPGARITFRWGRMELLEAFFYHFDCDGMRLDGPGGGFALAGGAGGTPALLSKIAFLSPDRLARLRPLAQTTWENSFGMDAARLSATWSFPALLSEMVVRAGDVNYYSPLPPAERLRIYMESDPMWKKGVVEMARDIGVPLTTLRDAFKRQFGMTPMEWREKRRLRRALYYIRETQLPFKAIGERLGMAGRGYLGAYVRRLTGKTPRQLRAREN